MSGSPIGWKRVKKLNRERGESFVTAWTYEHDWWHCIRHDGTSTLVNVRNGEVKADESDSTTTTQRLLRERVPRLPNDAVWLAELDARYAELHTEASPSHLVPGH